MITERFWWNDCLEKVTVIQSKENVWSVAEFMNWKTHMLSKIMIWRDFFERFYIYKVVSIQVDVKIFSDQGSVGEGADQRKKILKIFKEIFDGLVRRAGETDKVIF